MGMFRKGWVTVQKDLEQTFPAICSLINKQRECQSTEKGRKRDQKHKWQTRVLEKERKGGVCYLVQRCSHLPVLTSFSWATLNYWWITKILNFSCNLGQMPTSFRASVSHPKTEYDDSTYLADSEDKVHSRSNAWCFQRGHKKQEGHVAASWWLSEDRHRESFTALYGHRLRVSGYRVTEIFLTKQRQKWWEGCLISHRVKEKAEQPSLKKDLKDGGSNVPKGKNLREIASGCQNDLIPTQLALWITNPQVQPTVCQKY